MAALEAGEASCETENGARHKHLLKHLHPAAQGLLQGSDTQHVHSSSPGAIIRKSVHLQTMCKA